MYNPSLKSTEPKEINSDVLFREGQNLMVLYFFAFCLTNTASVHNTGNVLMCGRLQPSVTLALTLASKLMLLS